jgi:antitoxin ParD1/3/4
MKLSHSGVSAVQRSTLVSIEKRTISLPAEHAAFIDKKVAAGDYASASEVVRAGLRALQERDAAMEPWLREEVVPAYNKMKANPSSAIDAKKAFDELRAHHAAKTKGKA